jgi:hypothetical protein
MTPLEEQLQKTLNLESIPVNVSIIDSVKIYYDFFNEQHIIKIFSNAQNLTTNEEYIKQFLLNPFYLDYLYISQTYYSNIVSELYLTLNNPFLFNSDQFKNIANNIEWLNKIPYIIETCLTKSYEKFKYFFNEYLFRQWTNDYTKITFEKYQSLVKDNNINDYKQYEKIWVVFESVVVKVKEIINKFYDLYKTFNQIPGHMDKDFYAFCVRINTTLELNIEDTLKMGIKELKKMTKLLDSHINIPEKCLIDKIKIINNKKENKYKSEEEFINDHKQKIDNYYDYFVNKKSFPLLVEPKLVMFNDKRLAGGYWMNDTFYLNTSSYSERNKFETTALILHETIPGHHLQLSNYMHSNIKNVILHMWFPVFINGFCEGWGLFAEQLGYDVDETDYIGIISFHMFRTLRIIADISIHYYGKDPKDLIELFSKYLPMSDDEIKSEIYRYVCLPGQALCYKLGYETIKKIYIKKFNRYNKLLNDDALDLYKELISSETIALDLLYKKYNLK